MTYEYNARYEMVVLTREEMLKRGKGFLPGELHDIEEKFINKLREKDLIGDKPIDNNDFNKILFDEFNLVVRKRKKRGLMETKMFFYDKYKMYKEACFIFDLYNIK